VEVVLLVMGYYFYLMFYNDNDLNFKKTIFIMNVVYSDHAKKRMKHRGVTELEI